MIKAVTKFTAITLAVLGLSGTANAATETYKFDDTHTAITWHISHFGFSTPSGKFMSVDGTLNLDETNPAASSVEVTIQVAEGKSGVVALDEHLAAPDFFDTAKFPTATFKSTAVEMTGKDTAKVTGDLTIRGITKPVVLDVKLNKLAENFKKVKTAGLTASTTIKRSDFGMTAYLPDLGDEIKIDIESEANIVPPTDQ